LTDFEDVEFGEGFNCLNNGAGKLFQTGRRSAAMASMLRARTKACRFTASLDADKLFGKTVRGDQQRWPGM
jgi:hypothetical protein